MNTTITPLGLAIEEVQALIMPFPEDVLDIYQGFKYIPVEHVIERLNQTFNYNWDFTAKTTVGEKEQRTSKNGNTSTVTPVYADVTLTVRSSTGSTITRFGSGGGLIGYGKSEGDGHKSAVSDALKKAAQSLGVGLYISIEAKRAKKAKRSTGRQFNNNTNFTPPNIGPAATQPNVGGNTGQPVVTAGGFLPPTPV